MLSIISIHFKFTAVLGAMLGSTIPIAIIGTRFAMSIEPFWTPIQFSACVFNTQSFYSQSTAVPIVGMLCGATISGMIVALNYILKEFQCVISSLPIAAL